jgi:hypothetical protein
VNSLTPAVRLLLEPSATYRSLSAQPAGAAARVWARAVGRGLIPAGIAGITTAVSATGRITWSLALSGALCWSLLTVLQAATATLVVSPTSVALGRGLDLFFLGHAAWTLWLLVCAAAVFAMPRTVPLDLVLLSALVPFAWTSIVVQAFFREVAGLDRGRAISRTVIHQALTFLAILLYVGWAVQLWPRLVSLWT